MRSVYGLPKYLGLAFALAGAIATSSVAFGADETPMPPLHLSGRVTTPGGKPAAAASLLYDIVDFSSHTVLLTRTLTADAAGSYDVTIPADQLKAAIPANVIQTATHPKPNAAYTVASILYVTSPQGVAIVRPDPDTRQKITLQPFTSLQVRLVDQTGKPLANIPLAPKDFFFEHAGAGSFTYWDAAIADLWNQTTDADGTATFTHLPQGYTTQMDVADDRYASLNYRSATILSGSATTPPQTIHLVRGVTLTGQVRYGPTGLPAANALMEAAEIGKGPGRGWAKTDKDGRYQITRLTPGRYNVSLNTTSSLTTASPLADWTTPAQQVTASAGTTQTGLDFSLTHGALLTGHVTDKATGKPVAGAVLYVAGPAHPANSQGGGITFTGPDGVYRFHVSPGVQQVSVSGVSDPPREVQTTDGQITSLDLSIVPYVPPAPSRGVVLGPDDKPVAGAEVLATSTSFVEMKTVSDDTGHFVFDRPGLPTDARLYARKGTLATLTSMAPTGEVTLRLTADAQTALQGRVTATNGKPVAGAKVTLIRWQLKMGTDVDTTKTDAAGHYSFRSAYAGFGYMTRVNAAGYGIKYSNLIPGAGGKTLTVPPLAVPRANRFIAGVVTDLHGKPVPGATVTANFAANKTTITDRLGHFRLDGVPGPRISVQVQAPAKRWAFTSFPVDNPNTVIMVKSEGERQAENHRFVAALNADKTNHGNGQNADLLLHTAEAQAEAGKKKVFLVFHASWCGPCFVLHRFLEDPQVRPIMNAHFVVQDLDIWEHKKNGWENPGGTALYKKYKGPNSVPFFAVLDARGTKLGDSMHYGQNMGVPREASDVLFFLKMLKRTAPSLTARELATLKSGLKRSRQF